MKKENHNFLHEIKRKIKLYFNKIEKLNKINPMHHKTYSFLYKFEFYMLYEFDVKLGKLIKKHERTENELRQKLENAEKKIQEYEKMLNL